MPKYPHVNDHKNRQAAYKEKGQNALTGSTPEERFTQHVNDTVDSVSGLLENLQAGAATFDDARLDLTNYAKSAPDIWKAINKK